MTPAEALYNYIKRYYGDNRAWLDAAYSKAAEAMMSNQTEVLILNSAMPDGGSAAGEMKGDPVVIMAVCERLLKELDATEAETPLPSQSGITYFDMSRRQIRT